MYGVIFIDSGWASPHFCRRQPHFGGRAPKRVGVNPILEIRPLKNMAEKKSVSRKSEATGMTGRLAPSFFQNIAGSIGALKVAVINDLPFFF